ncbi:FAD-dependent sensor of blue light [Hoeflea marina]|uniref:FAD-dependent sensor of blue light n=1 Tax=Hoeflea marina TaxID=274592 RepID=A0A317PPH7_9HYPH|nr:BLUF domain-containing protein [Hoeflea marina]PWW01818.1 FAD-dependent sensor of blue light [Hoeflea marina]
MIQLLYVSVAARAMADADFAQILETSRANNEREAITGVLLWAEGAFVQILEGETDPVHRTLAAIRRDTRHTNLIVVIEQETEKRAFSDWSMGFKRLDPVKADDDRVFRSSHSALARRISTPDGGMLLNMILALDRDVLGSTSRTGTAA